MLLLLLPVEASTGKMAAETTAVVTDKMAEETFCATMATDSDMKVGMRVMAQCTHEGKKVDWKGTVLFFGELAISAGPTARFTVGTLVCRRVSVR